MLLLAAVISAVVWLAAGVHEGVSPGAAPRFALLALGAFCTGLATVLYYRIVNAAGATFLSLINYLIPVWAVGIGALARDRLSELSRKESLIAARGARERAEGIYARITGSLTPEAWQEGRQLLEMTGHRYPSWTAALQPDGDTIASVIPAELENVITPSGETASDGREIYVIDVSALPNGVLDPSGLLLGNDVIFRIEGGALRIADALIRATDGYLG